LPFVGLKKARLFWPSQWRPWRIRVMLLMLLALTACGKPTKPVLSTPAPVTPSVSTPSSLPPTQPATTTATPSQGLAKKVTPPPGLTKPIRVEAEAVSLWSDEFLFAGWRIQRHFYSGQSRLVDARGFQRAVGNYAICKQAFDYLRAQEAIKPRSRRLILLLHGLGSTPKVMEKLKTTVERDGFDAMAVTYPTTEQGVSAHADGVERLLQNLEGYDEVTIIAHSLGGLITRATLSRASFAKLPVPVRRVIMLGTPNQGATLAEMLRPLARMAANDLLPTRARQLGPIPAELRFGVIAGGASTRFGYNPILGEDNDGVVTVNEARAANMDDFLVLPVTHSAMVADARVLAAVRQFMRTGTFRAPKPVG
jgi:pimeloyl-ACP methyl ester carboxylesterase